MPNLQNHQQILNQNLINPVPGTIRSLDTNVNNKSDNAPNSMLRNVLAQTLVDQSSNSSSVETICLDSRSNSPYASIENDAVNNKDTGI